MGRRVASIVITAMVATVLFASVATSGGVNVWSEPQWEATPQERTPEQIDTADSLGELVAQEPDDVDPTFELPEWIAAILRVALLILVIALVVILGRAAWRARPRVRWRRRPAGEDFEALPDVAAAIVRDAEAQRDALRTGEPRNAIVQCWLRLEDDVAAAGLRRNPAHTSVEFTERVLGEYSVDPQAIAELSALYREARFSDHPLDESARSAALDALDRLHHALSADRLDDAPSETALRAST